MTTLTPAVQKLQNVSPSADTTVPSQQELDLLFGPLYDEFFNDEIAESSSRNIGNSNVHTFNQPRDSEYRWTKDHPLTQVRGNPSKPVQTRRQLATDPEMCMFALTVSIVEPKNIKEAMADSAWIEAMQDELHQFDRLQVWELVDKPFGKNIIKLKLLWKNKKDEDQTVIRNQSTTCRSCRLPLNLSKALSGGYSIQGDKLVSWKYKKQDCSCNVISQRLNSGGYLQVVLKSYALSWKPCQGDSLNLPNHRIHKDGDGDASFQLKSDSLPHAHAQTTKTFYKHQDSRIMKAQELKTKTSAQTLILKITPQKSSFGEIVSKLSR
ncbi:hypothetical protein Tco_0040568 [Tanacetum coccineum]